jgi:hypothetical protein
MSNFEEQGRIYVRGKVLKLRFKIPNSTDLAFFCFKEDIQKLFDGSLVYVRVFADEEFQYASEQKINVKA